MVKVGWTRQWIEKEVGSPIAPCVIDTSKSIPKTDAAGKTTNNKMSAGRFEWSELIPKATGDSSFVKAFKDTASADISSTLGASASEADITGLLGQILTAWSKTPVGSSPSMGGPAEDRMAKIVRGLLSRQYGANELYSGMGAPISEQGDLGAREVMVENNGTGFGLTADNHVIVDLGTYTNADVDKALSPAPAGGP